MLANPATVQKVAKTRDLNMKKKALEKQINALKAEIQTYMGEAEELTRADGAVIYTYKFQTYQKFNKDLLKVENPDLWEEIQTYFEECDKRVGLIK